MAGLDEVPAGINLQEFSSREGDTTLFYQLLRMSGSVYVWVGTQQASLDGMVAALESRRGPSVVSTLLGPSSASSLQASQLAERLQRRVSHNILLSLNVPSDELLPHVETRLLEELCAV